MATGMAFPRFQRTTLLLIGLWLGGLAAWLALEEPHGPRLQSPAVSGRTNLPQDAAEADVKVVSTPQQKADRVPAKAGPLVPMPFGEPNPPTPSDDDVPPCLYGVGAPLPIYVSDECRTVAPDRTREADDLFQTLRREYAKSLHSYPSMPGQPEPVDLMDGCREAYRAYTRAYESLKELPTYNHTLEFRGRITDEIGNPLAGASVFTYLGGDRPRAYHESESDWRLAYGDIFRCVSLGRTDETGHFALTHTLVLRCPPDITVELHAEDTARTKSGVVTLKPGSHHEYATLVCPRTGDLEVALQGTDGQPVAGAAIVLDWDPRDPAFGAKGTFEHSMPRSDEHGRIEATGIAAGLRVLRLLGPAYRDVPPLDVHILPGQTTSVIVPPVSPCTLLLIQFSQPCWAYRDVELLFRDVSGLGRTDLRITAMSDEHGRTELVLGDNSGGAWDVFEAPEDQEPILLGKVDVRPLRATHCDLGKDPTSK